MSEVADKSRTGASHVRAVKQLVSVKTSVKKNMGVVEKYIAAQLKDRRVPDVPACADALVEHYRQQDCSVVSGKYIACGVKGLHSTADVAATDVTALPLDEAKRILPAWALLRAAKEQGFEPVAVCHDKMEDGEYVVKRDGVVPASAQMLHVARTKSIVSNGHTDALTVWNANSKCYPTKPITRQLTKTQQRVVAALENVRHALSLDVEYAAAPQDAATPPAAPAAAAAAAAGDGSAAPVASAPPRPNKKQTTKQKQTAAKKGVKRARDTERAASDAASDAAPEDDAQQQQQAAPPSPKRAAVDNDTE